MKRVIVILIVILGIALMSTSCADSKKFTINNKEVTVEPYGWFDGEDAINDSINYELCIGNVVLDVIFCETIVVPIILTGDQLYEPVSKK